MIPERFCIDYPSRVLTLLERLSPQAADMDLSTTFIVSLAMPMLVIPFERLNAGHMFSDAKVDSALHDAPGAGEVDALPGHTVLGRSRS